MPGLDFVCAAVSRGLGLRHHLLDRGILLLGRDEVLGRISWLRVLLVPVGGGKESVQLLLRILVEHLDAGAVSRELLVRGLSRMRHVCLRVRLGGMRSHRMMLLLRRGFGLVLHSLGVRRCCLAGLLGRERLVVCVRTHESQLGFTRLVHLEGGGLGLVQPLDLLSVSSKDETQFSIDLRLLGLLPVVPARLGDFEGNVLLERGHVRVLLLALRFERVLEQLRVRKLRLLGTKRVREARLLLSGLLDEFRLCVHLGDVNTLRLERLLEKSSI
mmetsp:Transcript_53894/g.109870  ORF Transcript_53894/g.109870 Transcript_53894/m.109870 type:complete len:272 (-) Transcript_53894:344-1159(-)